ncbi:cation:proton antiporter [Desulfogranum marinum]|uniref:cation:proton antiporter domain-containing protein n=1 Tax=Desulfogranum marinum TaxID=453220 RepID=UPI0029C85B45|nr:cation:proton antiporter [Desulfogranum marinum]
MYENLTAVVIFIFLYIVISGRLQKTPINGAFFFILFGLIASPLGLGFINVNIDAEELRTLAEVTLALVLFTDASNANLSVLKKVFYIPGRLLLIGLPLTILFGFAAGLILLPNLTFLEIAILATMLAPTVRLWVKLWLQIMLYHLL